MADGFWLDYPAESPAPLRIAIGSLYHAAPLVEHKQYGGVLRRPENQGSDGRFSRCVEDDVVAEGDDAVDVVVMDALTWPRPAITQQPIAVLQPIHGAWGCL